MVAIKALPAVPSYTATHHILQAHSRRPEEPRSVLPDKDKTSNNTSFHQPQSHDTHFIYETCSCLPTDPPPSSIPGGGGGPPALHPLILKQSTISQ
ncbi:Hypothetical protein FKW44_022463 [Caligus rogercresseyi]|uniref:Uncharacterized protein n=1 Tax=Caligus rogercresseyi TaxID=217165 RepID=A0A7T8GMJ4_CALRO|nr:Hypothetical protein FKW44_022463 [Caligus rogercresseyi]